MKIHRRQAKQAPPLSEVYKTEESQSQMDLKERLKLDQLIVCLFFPVFFLGFHLKFSVALLSTPLSH